jgi:hypothetical protein
MTHSLHIKVPPFCADRSFPYVLLCSTLGATFSLAGVWITTALSAASLTVVPLI